MPSRVQWSGLDEFKATLRQIPVDLRDDSSQIVVGKGNEAKAEVIDAYANVTGNLDRGVRLDVQQTPFGVLAILMSNARHAHLYEFGTKPRYNGDGSYRGEMPAKQMPTFISIAQRKRREMYQELMALLERVGFQVSGDGGNG